MALNTAAFQEPRGVMRILQFIFAICAFATVSDYASSVELKYCKSNVQSQLMEYSYPFKLDRLSFSLRCPTNGTDINFVLGGDFSQDAQFFVATGVLAFLYCIGIVVVYALFDHQYQSNALVPLADFVITAFLAVLWISSSSAWSNAITGLKASTDPQNILDRSSCKEEALQCQSVEVGSFSSLNVSAILGFLNFFLWASDLWFLYKETQWFKAANQVPDQTSPTALA